MKRPSSLVKPLPPAIVSSLTALQDGLNSLIDNNWRRVRCLDDWALAITMESTELIDSYPWKWWKNLNATVDIPNVRVELVDILHFSLSGALQMESMAASPTKTAARQRDESLPCPADEASAERLCDSTPSALYALALHTPLTDAPNAIRTFRNVIHLANCHRFDIINEIVICAAEDLEFNLVAYYLAKHTLNYIRQLGGYKNGTYTKVRDGKEDNVLLHDCIKSVSLDETLSETQHQKVWNDIMQEVYNAFAVSSGDRMTLAQWIERSKSSTPA